MNVLDKVRQAKEVVEYDLEHVPRILLHIFQMRYRELSVYELMLSTGNHADEKAALELAEACIRCDIRPPAERQEPKCRRSVRKNCPICGQPISEIRRADATYCSGRCRRRAARQRENQRKDGGKALSKALL